jgi:tRNA(fMet)-specific endonuclease VapC
MKYLLDTNIISFWAKKSHPALLKRMLATPPSDLSTSVLVEHELRYGFARNPAVKSWPIIAKLLDIIPSHPLTRPAATHAAALRNTLADQGTPIGPYDLLIAATAIEHGATLVTNNTREFLRIPGVVVEDWTQDRN